MTAKSHVVTTFNIAGMMPLILNNEWWLNTHEYYYYIAGILFGALFPDIDEEHSYIGRKFYFIAVLLNRAVGHRTLTLNLFIYVPFIIYGYIKPNFFALGFGIGAILHILEDSITNSGAKWALKPFFNHFALLPKRLRFSTNGYFEKGIYLPIVSVITIMQFAYIYKGSSVLDSLFRNINIDSLLNFI